MAGLSDFRTDYVYQDEKSGEFKNVQIKLVVDNDKIKLDMSADNLLSEEIIKNILHQLKINMLDKMNISVKEDCSITLNINQPKYKIMIDENNDLKIEEK
ncbi:MAG: hypothetical protein IJ736_03990 [Firmicutes bacterium]|nr:hypothetical protein [Bacillota bacterium]